MRVAILQFLLLALPASAAEPADQAQALATLVRPIVLASLPDPLVTKERDWGRQVIAPVGVKWDRLKPTVQKAVRNDGHWQRVTAAAIDPDASFELTISDLATPGPGKTTFTIHMAMNVRGEHEFQEWKNGVRVLANTTQARCRVGLRLDCACISRIGVAKGDLLPSAEVVVKVTRAECGYSDFVCEKVGKLHGKPAVLAGEAARACVRVIKPGLEAEILTKANAAILRAVESKPVRVELDKLLLGAK